MPDGKSYYNLGKYKILMAKWQDGKVARGKNGKRARWQDGKTARRQDGKMARWQDGNWIVD
jgi:hypothetical protein